MKIPSYKYYFLIVLVFIIGCDDELIDPAYHDKKLNQTWIPIANTSFLIPNKTWLKGYSRRATDGLVASISLHALAPKVEPYSKAIHEKMYPKLGLFGRIDIEIRDIKSKGWIEAFSQLPFGFWEWRGEVEEQPSKYASIGLEAFREKRSTASETGYRFVENNQIKYFVSCSDIGTGFFSRCKLYFTWGEELRVELNFREDYMLDSIKMADIIYAKLAEFEQAGVLYQKAHDPQPRKTRRLFRSER